MSGKSSLCHLLTKYLSEVGETPLYIFPNKSPKHLTDETPMDDEGIQCSFQEYTGKEYQYFFSLNCKETCYLIIDEAQKLYDNCTNFWSTVKLIDHRVNTKVICFASYGEYRPKTLIGTPIDFKKYGGMHDLKLSKEEFDELMKSYNNDKYCSHVPIDQKFADLLFEDSKGHVGLIKKTLELIYENLKNRDKRDVEAVKKFYFGRAYTENIELTRAVPRFSDFKLTPTHFYLITRSIYWNKFNSFSVTSENKEEKDVADELTKFGILYTTNKFFYKFPSNLIERIMIKRLFGSSNSSDHLWTYNTLSKLDLISFVIECLKRMDKNFLQKAKEFDEKPLQERHYQLGFFTAMSRILPKECVATVDVGGKWKTEGKLDFYINDLIKWRIELMRDNNNIEKHLDRFKADGIYASIDQKESILVHFRPLGKIEKTHPCLLSVEYESDFSFFRVSKMNKILATFELP